MVSPVRKKLILYLPRHQKFCYRSLFLLLKRWVFSNGVNPVRKVIILILIFYILALFQTSFLVHFRALNLILILVIFINLFERAEGNLGFYSALLGGFFLDIFSEKPLGFHILSLLILALLVKMVLKRYIQLPIFFK